MKRSWFVWLVLSTIWGSTWLAIKIGLADLPPITFAGVRFLIAAVPLVAIMAWRRAPLPRVRSDWTLLLVSALLTFTLNYGLIFWGEIYISSGLSAILYCTLPLFGQVFAHRRLPAERMTPRKVGGALLGIAGVALIFGHELNVEGTLGLLGCAAVVLAAAVTAYAGVMVKEKGGHLDPVTITTTQIVIGFIPLVALGLVLDGNPLHLHWTARSIAAVTYLAIVGSATTFVLLYWLFRHMPVTQTQLIPLSSTLLAVLLGAAVLGETLSWRTAVGGAAILAGLVVAVRPGRLPKPA